MRTYQSKKRLAETRRHPSPHIRPYLRGDVAPVVLAAELLEVFFQERPHADDSVRHPLDFSQPLLVQRPVVQYLGSDASTVNRRVRVQRPDEDLELRVYPLLLLSRLAYDRESSNTLPVQPLER